MGRIPKKRVISHLRPAFSEKFILRPAFSEKFILRPVFSEKFIFLPVLSECIFCESPRLIMFFWECARSNVGWTTWLFTMPTHDLNDNPL
ncbi:MAG: hypothetical protein DRR16_29245 [Candidatus Parabeggiatoa sp. nov. 3]|nr:MAG: hypothetical protein DRQ99_32345 [Gammaproteobacteria bacterium]RKZ53805.1 MAG: hypothetical protein DRR00_03400 [Gammaproteobacteria bacterium]RKZ77656.1 MAG: hypothetical protein DRR16_29245 [Gammaproteobacteria bacterium]